MSKTVMIVEDNELNMKLFHDLLEANGYRTIQTRNGTEALSLAREHHPDLILMDIQLPEVSGLDVTRWIKEDETISAHSGHRRHRLRHEGRRGAHPRRGLRGLSVEAHLREQVHRDRPPLSRRGVRGDTLP
jgi:CheY-like chemotaxis protein